ncbi:MAG: glutamate--tRNA ligase family protein [Verrucomicrobiia bacterium]|jgi:glutamyl-tRNA synthetase
MNTRVRFAPSPTGFLHIGSVRTALFNWLYARHTGGRFVLRIEDTDVARNTKQSLRTILDGLKWLGLDWDEGPEKGGPLGPYFQSQRADIYKRRVKELIDKGIAYEREGAIRFKMTRQPIEIPDLIVGGVVRPLNETEMLDPDFVIVRSDGNPVFHLVNVVDDIEMQITHVIRGEDHLSNTPKHIALFRAFGVEPPRYAHIPMILNVDGTKMSKSDPDAAKARLASLQTYVDDGFVPDAVRNYLCLLGWSPKDNREVMPIEEVIRVFDLPQILRANARFDVSKLTWMNGEYIRALPLDRFIKLARAFLGRDGPPGLRRAEVATATQAGRPFDDAYIRSVLALVQEKVKLLKELSDRINYFFSDDYPFDPEAVKKSCSAPQTSERLTKLADKFASVASWDAASLEAALKALAMELGVKTGELIHPCRVAVSGKAGGPSLYHMLEVLGRDRVLSRLRRATAKFRR